jgi:molecular chaperone DnaK
MKNYINVKNRAESRISIMEKRASSAEASQWSKEQKKASNEILDEFKQLLKDEKYDKLKVKLDQYDKIKTILEQFDEITSLLSV